MIEEGFVKEEYKDLIVMDKDSKELVKKLLNHTGVYIDKWR